MNKTNFENKTYKLKSSTLSGGGLANANTKILPKMDYHYRGGSRGRVQGVRTTPPEMTCGFLIQLVFCQKKKLCGLLVLK